MRKAFTLIELLIVLAIIGVLMSLLFPAVNGVMDSARRVQAKSDVVNLATAVTAFETEYGRLPTNVTQVNKSLVETLSGIATNDNPRKMVFIEIPAAKGKKSGTNTNGDFVDPWGNIYQITMDLEGGTNSYDNTINVTAGKLTASGSDTMTLRKKVAVFNFAASSDNKKDSNYFRRAVRSWE